MNVIMYLWDQLPFKLSSNTEASTLKCTGRQLKQFYDTFFVGQKNIAVYYFEWAENIATFKR